jgi:hypothetical protein
MRMIHDFVVSFLFWRSECFTNDRFLLIDGGDSE